LKLASQTLTVSAAWKSADCDGDGLTNQEEKTGIDDPSTLAKPNGKITKPFNKDTDGDGVSDGQEALDGTDPNDPCSLKLASQTLEPNSAWKAADCDGDGLTNQEEKTGIDNPSTPANPNGKITDPLNKDTDGDGVTDAQEAIDGTEPNDPCKSNPIHVTLPFSARFLSGDCDGDGLTNGTEWGSNPTSPSDGNNNGIPDYLETGKAVITGEEIDIYNSISPNGDGENDVFVIGNIGNYPDNTVSIYNRWGVAVYEVDGYGQNDKVFKGISEGRVTIKPAEQLPEGTYFYIIRYTISTGEEKRRSGYLYIKR
jgi:gliding motility-associated-like protein